MRVCMGGCVTRPYPGTVIADGVCGNLNAAMSYTGNANEAVTFTGLREPQSISGTIR